MNIRRARGFTLLELLTVVAIIAILAGFVATALPRALEKAKLRRMNGAMNNIRTAMVAYYTEHSSYPPAYGYIPWDMREADLANCTDEKVCYFLKPYLFYLRLYGDVTHCDEFSESYDTNRDKRISLLEFSPIGDKDMATSRVRFPEVRYTGDNLPDQVQKQMDASPRPFIYIPVNTRQFKKAKQYWIESGDFQAKTWDPANPILENVVFPPSEYDAFALISVGPAASTFGVVPDPIGTEDPVDVYFITALRAYFLATRDLNDNGLLDFDFTARASKGEAKFDQDHPYPVKAGGQSLMANNQLPDPKAPNGYGPCIFFYP